MWLQFLAHDTLLMVSRPFVDLSKTTRADVVGLSTDAVGGKILGFGCIYKKFWCYTQWETNFISQCEPSIEFLELFALCVGIFTWSAHLHNSRILVHCDNESVVSMINSSSSSCGKCMVLIRKLTFKCLQCNLCIFAQHIMGQNTLPDLLSQLTIDKFKDVVKNQNFNVYPTPPSPELWLLRHWWDVECASLQEYRIQKCNLQIIYVLIVVVRRQIRWRKWHDEIGSSKLETSSNSGSSSISTNDMCWFIEKLRNESQRNSTKRGYYNVWKNFNQFCVK